MKPSALWKELLKIPDNFTMELLKCINGLKQSGHRFFKEVVEWLLSLEYTQSKVDLCVFFDYDDKGNLILVIIIHVDDILYTGITIAMEKFAKELRKKFEITDPKDINGEMFLGHFITYNPDKGVLTLSLTHYNLNKPWRLSTWLTATQPGHHGMEPCSLEQTERPKTMKRRLR